MDSVSQTSRRSSLNYTYDAWSNITASTGTLATTNPWHFASNYADAATGHLKLGARYYNPTTGRFTQPDPSGQEANTYAYASCNPANNTDPTGLYGSCGEGAIGAFVGFAFSTLTFPWGITGAAAAQLAFGYGMTGYGYVSLALNCPVAENNPGRRGSMEPALP